MLEIEVVLGCVCKHQHHDVHKQVFEVVINKSLNMASLV